MIRGSNAVVLELSSSGSAAFFVECLGGSAGTAHEPGSSGRHGKGFVLTGNDGRMEVRPVNFEVKGHLWMEVQVRPVNPEVQGRHLP